MSVVTELDLSLEITCIVAVQTKTAWADSLGASAFLIQHNRKSNWFMSWLGRIWWVCVCVWGGGSLPADKNIQMIAELALSIRTLGSQVQWVPLLIISVSHPARSLARIPSIFFFFLHIIKCRIRMGGDQKRRFIRTPACVCASVSEQLYAQNGQRTDE